MHENEKNLSDTQKIQWHPGFYAATEIELRLNKKDLDFKREYNLSKKPLQIDMLIVEKQQNVQIQNEIGNLFRKHNIIEYKSPDDGLNIDDFFKTIGYVYLYKGLGEKVNEIPLEEMTMSLFRETKPEKLMKELQKYGCVIENYTKGIYYIRGFMIPVQIIATEELKSQEHLPLKVLSKKADESDIHNFVDYVSTFKEPGDRRNADAVLQVSVSANKNVYDAIRRRDQSMCNALKEFFKEDLEEAHARGTAEGLSKGLSKGRSEGENRLIDLYNKLKQDNRIEEFASAMNDPAFLKKLYKEYKM